MSKANQKKRSAIDDLCINTIRTLSMDAVQKPIPVIRVPPWAWLRQDTPSGRACSSTTPPIRTGRIAIGLPFRRACIDVALQPAASHRLRPEPGRDQKLPSVGQQNTGPSEYGHTPGVETTTGPPRPGVANAVGMAMAECHLAACFNRPGHDIVDHHTYVMCGDGDLMEGVASEAASLAGHLGLGKLICLYDNNSISIEGSTDIAFTEKSPNVSRPIAGR